MNVFDIIGPVMIGPSSSHTAGAVRIGLIARALLAEEPVKVLIKLSGSFAKTFKGHGTDKALIGGLLGFNVDDSRLKESLKFASDSGLQYSFDTIDLNEIHPNTAYIEAYGKSGRNISLIGCSVGGGNIIIHQVNSVNIHFMGQYFTLIIPHKDAPGMVAAVTRILAQNEINIGFMRLYRDYKGGEAIMIIETDEEINQDVVKSVIDIPTIHNATILKPMV